MDIQQISEKAKSGALTPEEQKFFLEELNKEMLAVKEKEPEKYLRFMKTLNEALAERIAVLKS